MLLLTIVTVQNGKLGCTASPLHVWLQFLV